MPAPRYILPAIALAALIAFEASVLVMIATPHVSEQYRAFYIERTSDCWPAEVTGRIALGQRVWFLKADATGAARDLRVCGWIDPAGNGTWSLGTESRLLFDVGSDSGPLRLELDLLPYVRDNHPVQRMALSANGEKLAEFTLDARSGRRHAVTIPADAIGEDGRIELTLELPDAQSPEALGLGTDKRRLAIRLISLTLSPAGAEATGSPPPA